MADSEYAQSYIPVMESETGFIEPYWDWQHEVHFKVTSWLANVEPEAPRNIEKDTVISREIPKSDEPWAVDPADKAVCFARDFICQWLRCVKNSVPLVWSTAIRLGDLLLDYDEKPWMRCRPETGFTVEFYPEKLDLFDMVLMNVAGQVQLELGPRGYGIYSFDTWVRLMHLDERLHQVVVSLADQPFHVQGNDYEIEYYLQRLCAMFTIYDSLAHTRLDPAGLKPGVHLPVGACLDMARGESIPEDHPSCYTYNCSTHATIKQCPELNEEYPSAPTGMKNQQHNIDWVLDLVDELENATTT